MHRQTRLILAALSVSALVATTAPGPWATAAPPEGGEIIATKLANPRHLSVGPGNKIFVAEAGIGGAGPCVAGPEGDEVCFGLSGAITEVGRDGKKKRVVTGLPSLAGADGTSATGPTDVAVRGNNVAILLGLGGNAAFRDGFGDDAVTLGTLQAGRLGGRLATVADLVQYEEDNDPDDPDDVQDPDSNPGGFVAKDSKNWIVADAGGNDLVAVGKRGESTVAVLPNDREAGFPDFGQGDNHAELPPPGTLIPFQSVPTDVVEGPGGALYVSELTGFPFPVGASTIWKIDRNGQRTAYATGLTNVTSLDFRGNTLYAVQLTDGGLLAADDDTSDGSVRRVIPGAKEHPAVVSGLPAPYGIAIRGNTAYVTTGTISPDAGQVREISLR